MRTRNILWTVLALGWATSGDATDQSVRSLVEGNSAFALDLYAQLKPERGNLFFSPYSLSSALAMTYAGAWGTTSAEMEKVLHFTRGQDGTQSAFSSLQARLEEVQKAGGIQLAIANSLWPQAGHPFLPEYLAQVESTYGAAITPLDFAGETEAARLRINQWVAKKTCDKIQDLIAPGALDPLTRLVLVNAIYFKGNWASRFSRQQTEKSVFHVSPAATVPAAMMSQTHRFPYAEFDDGQIVKLPYADGGLSMWVVLPKETGGLGAIESRLSPDLLAEWRERLAEREVRVYLPKFKITWGAFALNKPLKALGMVAAFSAARADFSGMDGQLHGLYIGLVLHKAFVEVNEEGTEAAAATAVVMKARGIPSPPLEFRADHPFLFLIQEESTGSLLFLGRLADPTITD